MKKNIFLKTLTTLAILINFNQVSFAGTSLSFNKDNKDWNLIEKFIPQELTWEQAKTLQKKGQLELKLNNFNIHLTANKDELQSCLPTTKRLNASYCLSSLIGQNATNSNTPKASEVTIELNEETKGMSVVLTYAFTPLAQEIKQFKVNVELDSQQRDSLRSQFLVTQYQEILAQIEEVAQGQLETIQTKEQFEKFYNDNIEQINLFNIDAKNVLELARENKNQLVTLFVFLQTVYTYEFNRYMIALATCDTDQFNDELEIIRINVVTNLNPQFNLAKILNQHSTKSVLEHMLDDYQHILKNINENHESIDN